MVKIEIWTHAAGLRNFGFCGLQIYKDVKLTEWSGVFTDMLKQKSLQKIISIRFLSNSIDLTWEKNNDKTCWKASKIFEWAYQWTTQNTPLIPSNN